MTSIRTYIASLRLHGSPQIADHLTYPMNRSYLYVMELTYFITCIFMTLALYALKSVIRFSMMIPADFHVDVGRGI